MNTVRPTRRKVETMDSRTTRWLTNVAVVLTLISAAEAGELRVMSFNVRYGTAQDGENHWDKRRELVAQTIREFQPDLLGTQEILPFQADYLKSELSEFDYTGWSRDSSPNGEQCGIFHRTERFEKLDSGQFWLSETPDEKYSQGWDAALPRVATWLLLKDRKNNGRTLLFVNTHFDHRGREARANSAMLLHDWIQKKAGETPVLLTGDFNTPEGSSPWQTLTKPPLLRDTWRIRYPEPQDAEGTFHGFTGTPGSGRIDWILGSGHFDVTEAQIIRTPHAGRWPSDHFPVTAIVNWRGEEKSADGQQSR